jgi:hypothetical protein
MMFGHDAFHDTMAAPRDAAAPERLLLDATERALRAPKGKLAMALHLSRLKQPGARPYHSRIALALMQDTAQRLGGQVFPMRNTDLVLLCAMPEGDDRPGQPHAAFTLPESLGRLFGAAAPDAALTSIWRLDQSAAAFRDYISQRQAEPSGPDLVMAERHAGKLAPLLARAHGADLCSLLTQQTAVRLRAGRGLPLSARLSPSSRAFQVSPAALAAAGAVGDPANDEALLADPFIRRHLDGVLDARILALMHDDLSCDGKLTRPARLMNIPLHLALSPASVMSPGFARLAQMARARGAQLDIVFHAMEVAAEPALAAFAASVLRQAGFGLVLGGLDHAALAMIRPQAMVPAPDFLKLSWSPRLADGPAAMLAPVEAALARIGPDRVVLQDADGEAALIWAQSHGITQFQGPYLDAVQAASRIAMCHSARACTLRQCTARALGLEQGLRAGCGNPGLLDMQPAAIAAS